MREVALPILENGRVLDGPWRSSILDGLGGMFIIQYIDGTVLRIVASDGRSAVEEGWEHVSISTATRTPTWAEMNFVKNLFFDDEELVVQFHPPKSKYINCHPFCLHLFRPKDGHIRLPPQVLIGPKGG